MHDQLHIVEENFDRIFGSAAKAKRQDKVTGDLVVTVEGYDYVLEQRTIVKLMRSGIMLWNQIVEAELRCSPNEARRIVGVLTNI